MHRLLFVFLSMVSLGFAAACRSTSAPPAQTAASADTWAVVDGREIKRADVDKAYHRSGNASQGLAEEEILAAKLSVLDDLIQQDILIAKAAPLKIELADSELDKAFADAKKNIPDDAFQQELTKRGVTAAEMREGLRRELLAQKVIEHDVTSKITVTAQEVSDFFLANRNQFNLPEEAYHLAQIVVTPVRDAQVANRTGDDAATPQAAAEKVKMLMERLKAGANFAELAMGYSEDPETAPRGGDLGLVPMSRLKQAPPQLQSVVLKKEPGSVNVASMGGAHTLVLVVAHEQAGQRDLSTPGVSDRITEGLKARKEQVLRAAYLTAARSDADVVNHLARRIVEGQGKLPGATAAAPAPTAPAVPAK
jgi:peptidyl-prolyl cis-trans isomerase SurA